MEQKVEVALNDVVEIQRKIEQILNFTKADKTTSGSNRKKPRYMQESSHLRSQ